jgi:hypothetical protein
MPRQQTVEEPAMPVRPFHHGRDAETPIHRAVPLHIWRNDTALIIRLNPASQSTNRRPVKTACKRR